MNIGSTIAVAVLVTWGSTAVSESLAAAKTIRARTILTANDFTVVEADGAFSNTDQLVGLEARITLYEGRPIKAADVGPATLVERNQIIKLVFRNQYLSIATNGRSLARGGVGDAIRVMNLTSKSTVVGVISTSGSVIVGGDTDISANR